ncbi:hypothetical protein ACW0JT_20420 [Arthrobacter sp. SA17]
MVCGRAAGSGAVCGKFLQGSVSAVAVMRVRLPPLEQRLGAVGLTDVLFPVKESVMR